MTLARVKPQVSVRRSAPLAVLALSLLGAAPASAAISSAPDKTFVTNGEVNAIARSADQIYLGGDFTQVGPRTGPWATISTSSGEADASMPQVSGGEGIVNEIVADGSGGFFIGGDFTHVGGVARNHLAHIRADGSVDPSWDPNPSANVHALARSGSTLYVGGNFSQVGGAARSHVAAVDTTTGAATGWNPNANGRVDALAVSGSTVYIGGLFNGANSINSHLSGVTRNRVAAVDATTGVATGWNPDANNAVNALAISGSTVYIGGFFSGPNSINGTLTRNRLAAVDARTGELLPWAPAADGRVKALAVSGTSVYAAGDFTTVGGQKRDSLARLDATTGAVASTFKHSISGKPYALAAADGRLYLGGAITAVNGQTRTRLAAFNLTSGVLDATWKPTVDDQVEALATASGRIYAGGKFHKVNSTSGYNRLVALDPASGKIVIGFKPKATVVTYAIAVDATGVYTATGGQGGRANGYTLSGSPKWTAGFDGDAQAVAAYGGTVYVGGHFDNACRTPRTGTQGACLDGSDKRVKLAALDQGTGVLQSWTANGNGIEGVLTLATNTGLGAVAAGGAFTTINGVSRKRLAQFS